MHRKYTDKSQAVFLMDGLTSWVYPVLLYGHIAFNATLKDSKKAAAGIARHSRIRLKCALCGLNATAQRHTAKAAVRDLWNI